MLRYLLSLIIPVRFRSTFATEVLGVDVQAGRAGNHFRDDDHHDLVSTRWWQWRNRVFGQSTRASCIGIP